MTHIDLENSILLHGFIVILCYCSNKTLNYAFHLTCPHKHNYTLFVFIHECLFHCLFIGFVRSDWHEIKQIKSIFCYKKERGGVIRASCCCCWRGGKKIGLSTVFNCKGVKEWLWHPYQAGPHRKGSSLWPVWVFNLQFGFPLKTQEGT